MSNILRTDLAQFLCVATVSDTLHLQAQLCGAQDAIEQLQAAAVLALGDMGPEQPWPNAEGGTRVAQHDRREASTRAAFSHRAPPDPAGLPDRHPGRRFVGPPPATSQLARCGQGNSIPHATRVGCHYRQNSPSAPAAAHRYHYFGAPAQPLLEQWRPTLNEHQSQMTLHIDVPEGHRWKVFYILRDSRFPDLASVDHPIPSPQDPRRRARARSSRFTSTVSASSAWD
ncbi:unnamed protein product [Prorocentrum cordatum]|uniref:Uncharacterized protein n=1 Tax=Prorocentrum cordatum TaxID=2364126 RepID=A0ABN9XX45_9DINO|nr:unnamed protein product [Polarella glacialis]